MGQLFSSYIVRYKIPFFSLLGNIKMYLRTGNLSNGVAFSATNVIFTGQQDQASKRDF
jgi:hypothetical protein